ncbi:MAG: DUF4372 domain-containing protein [bacterium]
MSQVSSIFSPLLQQVPRTMFAEIVRRHQGERHARDLRRGDQFVAMLFCQRCLVLQERDGGNIRKNGTGKRLTG